MKAVLLSAERAIEVVDVDEPDLGDDDVLIDVRAIGICGSDLHAYRGFDPFRRPPVILGHEAAGEVDRSSGQRHLYPARRSCCRRATDHLPSLRTLSRRAGKPVHQHPAAGTARDGVEWHIRRTHRSSVDCRLSFCAPDLLCKGAMIEPLAVSYRAFRRAGVALGMRVAVLGVGNIGGLFAHLCAQAQASLLMVTDVKEYNLRFASSITTFTAVDARTKDVVERGLELTGGEGFDVVAVASGLLPACSTRCRPGGVIVVISISPEAIQVDATRMAYQEVDLRASLNVHAQGLPRCATQLVNGRTVDLSPVHHATGQLG
jgi:L-iditol 2-dehydrogenase